MLARNAASDAKSCAAMFGAKRTADTKKSAAYSELASANDTCASRSASESVKAQPLECYRLVRGDLIHPVAQGVC